MNAATVIKVLREVTHWGPLIAEAGKKIYEHTKGMFGDSIAPGKKTITVTVQELAEKISQLEQNDLDQTKLLSEMARQTDNLSKLTNVLIKRIRVAMMIAGISLLLAIYLLIK